MPLTLQHSNKSFVVTKTHYSKTVLKLNKFLKEFKFILFLKEEIQILTEKNKIKMFPRLKLLCWLFMGPTLGFDAKQRNSF